MYLHPGRILRRVMYIVSWHSSEIVVSSTTMYFKLWIVLFPSAWRVIRIGITKMWFTRQQSKLFSSLTRRLGGKGRTRMVHVYIWNIITWAHWWEDYVAHLWVCLWVHTCSVCACFDIQSLKFSPLWNQTRVRVKSALQCSEWSKHFSLDTVGHGGIFTCMVGDGPLQYQVSVLSWSLIKILQLFCVLN